MQRRARLSVAIFLTVFAAFAASSSPLWESLMRGNRRFVAGRLVYANLRNQRRATRAHQNPPVTVLSCADSRVPPELMFDRSVGDLFVVRVAGNVVDDFNLASIEYAIAKGYTKMIVVIGHQSCGAVEAALSGGDPGSPALEALIARIDQNLGGTKPPLREAIEMNARASAKQLVERSKIVREAVESGKVQLVTAYYSFDGRVTPLEK